MSLDDRDWYRERRERAGETRFLMFVLIAIAISTGLVWAIRNVERPSLRHVSAPPAKPGLGIPNAVPQPEAPEAITEAPQTIYRCTVNGRVTYSGPIDCRGSLTTVRPHVTIPDGPSGLSDYQVEMLRSADRRIAHDEAIARQDMADMRTGQVVGRAECASLGAEILSIDARARMPISSYEQDLLRARRQTVTARQFSLHC